MKLKKFRCEILRGQDLFVTINKNHQFHFSQYAAEVLELKQHNLVDFLQDEDQPSDWYMYVNNDGQFRLRKDKERLSFQNTLLSQKIKKSLGVETHKSVSIRIGKPFEHEGMKLIALLTSSFKSK